MKSVESDSAAAKSFHNTIRKHLDLNYNQTAFSGLHNYGAQGLSSIGKVFKQKLRPDSLTSKLFCFFVSGFN